MFDMFSCNTVQLRPVIDFPQIAHNFTHMKEELATR
jgi:hypothetical protein